MKKYLFIALVAFLAVTSASAQLRIKMGKNSPIEKLGRAEIAITNLYVDSVDENKLVEDAIRGMLEKLDPHSSYATAKETKAMNEPLNGSFDGIGVQFNMVDDTLLVIQPVTNGPSEQADVHSVNIGIGSHNHLIISQSVQTVFYIQGSLQQVELLVLVNHLLGQAIAV